MREKHDQTKGVSHIKRILCLVLAAALMLSACAQTRDEKPRPDGVPRPEGLFAYHRLVAGEDYGLINASGEVVVPLEYDQIALAAPYNSYYDMENIPAQERYFVAYQHMNDCNGEVDTNENPSTQEWEEEIPEDPMEVPEISYLDTASRMALISPEGKFLTGFDYYNIYRHEKGFVAQTVADPQRFVTLGTDGSESPMEDESYHDTLVRGHQWMWNGYTQGVTREGPDVPEEGFEFVLELPNGSYWGRFSRLMDDENGEPMPVDEYGKARYISYTYLYSAGGEQLSEKPYDYVEKLSDAYYYAYRSLHEGETWLGEELYILDANGDPVGGPYRSIEYWGIEPFVVARLSDEAVVVNAETFEEVVRIPLGMEDYYHTFRNGEHIFLSVSLYDVPARAYVLDTGEEIVLDDLTGVIESANADLSRFIVNEYGEGKGENNIRLVDREGNIYAQGYNSIYPAYGVLVAHRYNLQTGVGAQYLINWDGAVLLGAEYTGVEVLPGNAARAMRGDVMGLVDFAGNWIYSESIFEN